jgi:hypothetical protein
MGPGEPPPIAAFDALVAPDSHRTMFKVFQECNYLQVLEGNLDPAHISFLHKLFGKSEEKNRINRYAMRNELEGSPQADIPAVTDIWGEDVSPQIEFETDDFGIRYVSLRKAGPEKRYIRGGTWIMPNLVAAPGSTAGHGYNLSWHVPIDDERSWRFSIGYRRGGAADPERLLRREHAAQLLPNYRPIRNKANRFLQDRETMKTGWASGFGPSIVMQDVAITDSQGEILERPEERLGYTDKVIMAMRLMLVKAAKDFKAGRGANRRSLPVPVVVSDLLSNSADWQEYYARGVKEEESIALNCQRAGM